MKKTVWTLFDKCHIEFEKLSDHNIELPNSFSISILLQNQCKNFLKKISFGLSNINRTFVFHFRNFESWPRNFLASAATSFS